MDSKPLLSSPSLPIIITSPPTIPRGFLVRAVTIVLLLAVSLWANYEASKGFELTIPNPPTTTIVGRKFDLMFVSNGKAARMLLEASNAIEHILYPNPNPSRTMHFTKKLVRCVVLELASGEEEESTEMIREVKPGEYLILIKQEVLEQENVTEAMGVALYRAMAHVWVWGGTDLNKSDIVDGIVECLMEKFGFGLTSSVGKFVRECEERSEGFVARLNYAVHEMRSERVVDKASDRMIQELCLEHLQLASF